MNFFSSIHINIKKIIFFAVLFVAGIIVFSLLERNVGETQTLQDAADPSCPVLYFYENDTRVNTAYGYADEMDITSMRDHITPVGVDMTVDFELDTKDAQVTGISYEVRSTDGERLLENGDCSVSGSDTLTGTVSLQNLLEENEEYILRLIVSEKKSEISYYTRIQLKGDNTVDEALEFVLDFHDTTLSGQGRSSIATYVEPDSTKENDDLAQVDITSSLDQIMWADFEPEVVTEFTADICEMQDSYQTFTLRGRVKSAAAGDDAVYDVEEYFRVRVGEDRVYLLEYERTADRVIDCDTISISNYEVDLGLCSEDTDMVSNATGTMAAFVSGGKLWLVDAVNNEVTDIFGFGRGADGDERDLYRACDIKIMTMDESGTIEFVVYGYMGSGDHEGQTGVGLYRYDSSAAAVTEELFIVSDKSWQVLLEETGDLFYVNSSNEFFMVYDDALYKVDINTKTYEVVADGLKFGKYAVSESNSVLSWISEADSSTQLNVMDLDDANKTVIESSSGSYIRPLAYLGEDLLCGEAAVSDLITDLAGHVTFLMSDLTIYDEDLSEIKSYDESECFVVDVYEEDDVLHLERVTISGDATSEYTEDTIIDYNNVSDESAALSTSYTNSIVQTETILTMSVKLKDAAVAGANEILTQDPPVEDIMEGDLSRTMYYVYRNEKIESVCITASEAITRADDIRGVVVSSDNGTIWSCDLGTKKLLEDVQLPSSSAADSNIAKSLEALLNYEGITADSAEVPAEADGIFDAMNLLMPDYTVLDLCGCTTKEVLYYVEKGYPVLALTGNNDAVLIVGYDEYNTLLFYPEKYDWSYYGLNDSETLFSGIGSIFFGYID